MKTYVLPTEATTVHDVAHELNRPRQTVLSWINRLRIDYVQITQGEKIVATVLATRDVGRLRVLDKKRKAYEKKQAAK